MASLLCDHACYDTCGTQASCPGPVDVCAAEEAEKEPDEQPEPPPYPAHSNVAPALCPLNHSTPFWGFQARPP